MAPAPTGRAAASTRPRLGGSMTYLLLNFPLGIFWFVALVALIAVGVSTAIIWIGVPIAAFAVLLWRGGARLERARTAALLHTLIPMPYRPLPEGGQKARWTARLRDAATWRDLVYLVLLFPLGVIEFVLLITTWSVSLALLTLPIYYRYLPEGAYYFPAWDIRWITVDTTVAALPWAALGVLFVAATVVFTRALAGMHATFARSLLGPARGREHETEDLSRARPIDTVAGW
ncbi:sensor domain-containing protein [Amycolatopsis palatopharyngis]|uniref:sensor domain-containing protein n=1 Tax=Amycolatopsis palatopharyngis TaxID=187982 RepID=UPI000E25574E|nr:sensor domain-containing protein [Amycolatopsis palatopharyngis]